MTSGNVPLTTHAADKHQSRYKFWRTALILGMLAWPLLTFFVALEVFLIGAGGGIPAKNYRAYGEILLGTALLGLPVAIVSLLLARHFHKKAQFILARNILRIPFYLLLLVVALNLYLELLGAFQKSVF